MEVAFQFKVRKIDVVRNEGMMSPTRDTARRLVWVAYIVLGLPPGNEGQGNVGVALVASTSAVIFPAAACRPKSTFVNVLVVGLTLEALSGVSEWRSSLIPVDHSQQRCMMGAAQPDASLFQL
jgi:threonine/homoserine efflux transporter RhtA